MLRFQAVKNPDSLRKTGALLALCVMASATSSAAPREREKPQPTVATVDVRIGHAGCKVDLDNSTVGETGADGVLLLAAVEPGDHYIHVDCPGHREEAFFVSPAAGQSSVIKPEMAVSGNAPAKDSPLEEAARRIKLNHAVQQAVRLRARGDLDQAVQLLREATRLDPENSDLHRELGITFLLGKDWARARIEMLEAIRHNPQDADAHNGLGYALDKMGDLDGAVKEFRTATRLEPDDESYEQHYLEALGKIAARDAEQKEKRK
jgi:tetratricopeptide (TPR) repeat protein